MSRGLGDVYKRQPYSRPRGQEAPSASHRPSRPVEGAARNNAFPTDRCRLRPQPPGPLPPIASAQNARRLAGPRWETAASSLALSGKTPPCGPHPPRSRPIGKRHAPRHAQARKRRNDTNAGKDSPSSDPPPKTVGNAFAKYFHEIDRIYLQRIIFCLSLYPQ